MASLSSVSVFDNYRFRTAFNEELYNTTVKNNKVISEIALCGWRRLAAPTTEISKMLIHEFYANAIITEEEREEHGGHPYMSFVRGAPMNFSPENIRRVMRFKAKVRDSSDKSILIHCIMKGEDVHAKEIITDKIIRIAQGIKEKGKLGFPSTIYKLCKDAGVPLREFRKTRKIPAETPITTRRMESTRLPKNPQHQPQDNEDEDQPMPQAEEGYEEEQGEEHDYKYHQPEYDHQPEFQHEPQFQQPPLYEIPTYTDQHENDLHSIEEQLQNMMWLQQQYLENINKSQVEYMAELRTIKGKQQEMFENNDRFYNQVREEQREMAKEIQQVKNYQVNQTMIESARNKALMEELAAVKTMQKEFFSNQTNQYNMNRKEQNMLGKEILDVKKHQMNTITMCSSSSPNKYEPDQALIKIREQHANFSEVQRQLKEWTKNSSARECYSVWAHQQANPNLVEMPVHKITKQIYDNSNNNRPMFYGLLKSDLPPSETAPPPPKSKDPRDAPN
ncbi:hypothetical protein PIB30_076950 [Stylosanthes scabra]|uniref:Uncharacterized protein n=1 Tax=Stylosanthes scabra TaxID=79078 RepID=A0ABU6XND2_9FABA|nr:hypothetical protein [Stylosanthes scabra]